METIELRYNRLRLDDEEFVAFCQQNDKLKFERDANGTILIISNTGSKTGARKAKIIFQLMSWLKQQRSGHIFDSLTAFQLPSTAVRAANAAFVATARWETLTDAQQHKFIPLCPDFIIELRSPSDIVADLRQKFRATGWPMAAG